MKEATAVYYRNNDKKAQVRVRLCETFSVKVL